MTRGPRWPRSQPWPAVRHPRFSILHPRPRSPASGGWGCAPQTRARGQALSTPKLLLPLESSGQTARVHWGFTTAPNPDGPPPDRPSRLRAKRERFAIPGVNFLHGSPRMAASQMPQPGALTPPKPRRRHDTASKHAVTFLACAEVRAIMLVACVVACALPPPIPSARPLPLPKGTALPSCQNHLELRVARRRPSGQNDLP